MLHANLTLIAMALTPTLTLGLGIALQDGFTYRSTIGALQYLLLTRPDFSFSVNKACLFLHSPADEHWKAVKRILHYLYGTIDLKLKLSVASVSSFDAYSNADWSGCPKDWRSTSGWMFFLRNNLISWSTRKHKIVAASSTEAGYRALANTTAKLVWLRSLMFEIGIPHLGSSCWNVY